MIYIIVLNRDTYKVGQAYEVYLDFGVIDRCEIN
jgi:hypothetical protein